MEDGGVLPKACTFRASILREMAVQRNIYSNWTLCRFDSGTSLNTFLIIQFMRLLLVIKWDLVEGPEGVKNAQHFRWLFAGWNCLLVNLKRKIKLILITFRIFSMIFHSRDFWLTEYLDYFGAGVVIFYAFYASLMLTMPFLHRNQTM